MQNMAQIFADHQRDTRNQARERLEQLLCMSNQLNRTDRLMVRMYFENGNTCSQLAHLSGLNPGTVCRRIRKALKRLFVARQIARLSRCQRFSDRDIDLATEYFVVGRSMRKIARRRDISYYRVRKTIRRFHPYLQITLRQRKSSPPGTTKEQANGTF